MWEKHDNYMKQLKQLYTRTSKQTQNRLQELFDTFNFTSENIYSIANTKTKQRINTMIEEWKDKKILSGYFGMLASNIYRKTRVKNSEILELLIYSAYIEEQSKLDEYEHNVMYENMNYYYEERTERSIKCAKKEKRYIGFRYGIISSIIRANIL
jgi:hypothetical protein